VPFTLREEECDVVRRGLLVGRFQPLHKGHLKAMKDILEKVDELIIVVGSSQYSHTMENPFTTGERVLMIRQALTEEDVNPSRYWIIPVPDMHIHMIWVAEVIGYTPKFDTIYTNEPLTRRLFIESGFNVKPVPFHQREEYSSTEIRERILNKKNWEELVPETVAKFIKEINGAERLHDLARTDKA
jgi:nicotinamide-nucleotide adenylyltransferase